MSKSEANQMEELDREIDEKISVGIKTGTFENFAKEEGLMIGENSSEITEIDLKNEVVKNEEFEKSESFRGLDGSETELGLNSAKDSKIDEKFSINTLKSQSSEGPFSSRVLGDSENLIYGSLSERKDQYSACKYLQRMGEIEASIKKGKNRLQSLKDSLGGIFDKLIQESKTRESRSPTRSPIRSRGSGLSTPSVTQKSLNTSIISEFRTSEDNIIDLPSKFDLNLERLSIQTKYPLVLTIFGLSSKKSFSNHCLYELNELVSSIKHQESSATIMRNAYKASNYESESEFNNLDQLISEIKLKNSSLLSTIDSISNKTQFFIHDKQKLEKELQALNKEKNSILSNFKKPEFLNEIKEFESGHYKLEKSRIDLEGRLIEMIEENKEFHLKLAKELKSLLDQKDESEKESIKLLIECEKLEFENHKLSKDLTIKLKSASTDEDLDHILKTFQSWSRENSDSVDLLKRQVIHLRSAKLESTTDSQNLVQKIDKENKSLILSQNSIQKVITQHGDSIQEYQKKFKPIKQTLLQLEELYSKKSGFENLFELNMTKLHQSESIFSNILKEVNYFSDFIFSTSQWVLQHQRIKDQVKLLLQDKNIEFDVLKSALSELKSKNPAYLPVQGDYIDEALASYLNARDGVLEIPFYRESYGVYYFGTKKLMLSQERGKLIVKTGGGFLPIEQFIDTYLVPELDKQLKAKNFNTEKIEYNPILDYKCDTPIIEEDI